MKGLTFLIVAVLAIVTLVWYRGKNANADAVSGRVEGVSSENLFTPSDGENTTELPKVLKTGETTTERPAAVVASSKTTTRRPAAVVASPASVSKTFDTPNRKAVVSAWERKNAESLKMKKSGRKKKNETGFFMDNPEEVPATVKQWEKNYRSVNKATPPPLLGVVDVEKEKQRKKLEESSGRQKVIEAWKKQNRGKKSGSTQGGFFMDDNK